jgi:nucleoid DNA-binding protein
MDRGQFVHRISAASGVGFDEVDRVLDAVLRELCGAAARHQPVDFGDLGRFEPEEGGPRARFRPAAVHTAFGGGRRD